MRGTFSVSPDDLAHCHVSLPEGLWRQLAGRRIFMTGGTGFVGKWLIVTLMDADRRLGLGCRITILTRNASAFRLEYPQLADQVTLLQGDVRNFEFPAEAFDIVIHAATDVVAQSTAQAIFDTCVEGTRRVLSLAESCGATDLLMVSSGAVYGRPPPEITHISEGYLGAPDTTLPSSAYAEGKRAAEWLACAAAHDSGLKVKIARCFAFVGPYLPLDRHFAIGNFLGSCLNAQPIMIEGDGTPVRSYLYAADMAAWLWAVLLKGRSGQAYNVGAEEAITIADLAHRVAATLNIDVPVLIRHAPAQGHRSSHYVPDTRKSREELGLPLPLPLQEAIVRTARWHQWREAEAAKA